MYSMYILEIQGMLLIFAERENIISKRMIIHMQYKHTNVLLISFGKLHICTLKHFMYLIYFKKTLQSFVPFMESIFQLFITEYCYNFHMIPLSYSYNHNGRILVIYSWILAACFGHRSIRNLNVTKLCIAVHLHDKSM